MDAGNFRFNHLASITFDQLPAADQAEIVEHLRSLNGIAPAHWPAKTVRKIPSEPSIYILRVNGSLRAFLRMVEGEPPEVVDIVRQEALDLYAPASKG